MIGAGRTIMSEIPPSETSEPGSPLPGDKILFSRRVLYWQAILGVALAAAAFWLGYAIGRGGPAPEEPARRDAPAKQRVLVEGKLTYRPPSGEAEGDDEAVIFLLPAGEFPLRRMGIEGIGPRDRPPSDSHPALAALRQLGGNYARAEASGRFSLVAPEEGKYHLLAISAHVARPADSPIDEADLIELDRYFRSGRDLIGEAKYRWTAAEIGTGFRPLEIDFGRDEER
jgi:hypothetical protein